MRRRACNVVSILSQRPLGGACFQPSPYSTALFLASLQWKLVDDLARCEVETGRCRNESASQNDEHLHIYGMQCTPLQFVTLCSTDWTTPIRICVFLAKVKQYFPGALPFQEGAPQQGLHTASEAPSTPTRWWTVKNVELCGSTRLLLEMQLGSDRWVPRR